MNTEPTILEPAGTTTGPPAELIVPATARRIESAIDTTQAKLEAARAQAQAVQVTDHTTAEAAGAILSEVSKRLRDAEASRKEVVGPIKAHAKMLDGRFKEITGPLEAQRDVLKSKLATYHEQVEAARRAEEKRIARETAERERQARERREAEERQAREAREAAEAAARQAELDAARAAQDDDVNADLADQAAELAAEELDRAKMAEESVAAQPDVQAPAPIVPAAPKVSRIQTRKRWVATVTDPDQVPRQYLTVNQAAINQAVRDGIREIPGVHITQKTDIAA